jgi:hypothetical protein
MVKLQTGKHARNPWHSEKMDSIFKISIGVSGSGCLRDSKTIKLILAGFHGDIALASFHLGMPLNSESIVSSLHSKASSTILPGHQFDELQ